MINCILHLLEKNAKERPDFIALEDENLKLTYSEYRNAAAKIGTYILSEYPGKRNRPVAVLIDRNILSVCAFMGVAYSGNMYVPIDTAMPKERIKLIFSTLDPIAVIDARNSGEEYPGAVKIGDITEKAEADEAALKRSVSETIDLDPLYAIFTSGSTGVPKGVAVSHGSVLDLVDSFEEAFGFEEGTVFGNQAPFDFDVSVKDIYNALKCGGRVSVIPKKLFMTPTLLIRYLAGRKIDTIIWAVSAMRIVADFDTFSKSEVMPELKNVFFSGEVMPVKTLNYWRGYYKDTRFVNLYGPTEITCNCTYYVVDREFDVSEKLPIGIPFVNTRIFLKDENGNFTDKANTIGEICVSGRCVALGYWNDKEKTGESFALNPYITEYPSRIYTTGDLGYYDEKGILYYTSRKDYQIKHMGHRIELGEIEVAINSLSFLDVCVCLYDESREKIVCFYQAAEECKTMIVKELSKKLPKYMWPNDYRFYDRLPMNKNGKIDRTQLKKEM